MDHQDAVRTLAAERYLLDELSDAEREVFEAHYFECATCAESVRAGAVLADAARSGRIPAAAPVSTRGGWSFAAVVPMAAAAALALVVGYQSLVTIPGLRQAIDAPRALTPIALAPMSRGEGAEVSRGEATDPVALALDINADTQSSQLVYDLRTDSGDVVLSGVAPVPSQGTPLLLLIPGTSLTTGQYEVVVRDGASPAREMGTYRFIVR
jgi:hypothetical protein